jgi:purine-nucleoside phosphorylase
MKAPVTMLSSFTMEDFDHAADYVRKHIRILPKLGIILGSGMGSIADSVESPAVIPYADIPGWPESTVEGHAGRLIVGTLAGRNAAVLQGRAHFYEGYAIDRVTFPVRVLQRLGVKVLIVANAAGGINPELAAGDLMLITDHLNLLGMGGTNPLRGPNDDRLGPRFTDMSQAYDRGLRELTKQAAAEAGLPLREGVYACLAGPSFETPVELRFLRLIGADVVGMSTVPEVIVACHGGMRVLGISVISNQASLDGSSVASHEEVLAATGNAVPNLNRLLKTLFGKQSFPC